MIIEIAKPETEALIQRHLRSGRFHDVDELLTTALGSLDEQTPAPQRRTGQELIDACAKVRGLLTDEEVDTLFRRTPSYSRPVDFE